MFHGKAKNKVVTTKSSAEAEYRAIAHGCCELLWLKILLEELGFPQDGPMLLYFDSTSAIKLANNSIYNEKTKQVEVDCHFICKKIEKKDVALLQGRTKDKLADFLTKSVTKTKMQFVLSKLGIGSIYAPA